MQTLMMEFGMGSSLRRGDYTQAAERAVRDALWRNSINLAELFGFDRAAMKIGADDSDAYLAEWRKADPYTVEGEADAVADAEVARIDAEFDRDRIKTLIANDGWA